MAAVIVGGFAANAQTKASDLISAASLEYNFGKIKQGAPVTTFFELKNTSAGPIVIESATAGCGCTTPEYDRGPIGPNNTTKLKVGYNAAAMGPFTKDVTVKLAGIEQPLTLRITGEVIPAENAGITAANNKANVAPPPPPRPATAKPVAQKAVKNKPATVKKSSKK